MKTESKKQRVARRDLLRVAGLGGVVGASALAAKGGKAEATSSEDVKTSGYRETAHVRTYYDLAKF